VRCVVYIQNKMIVKGEGNLYVHHIQTVMTSLEASSLLDNERIEMSFKMADLDWFPGHRMEDGGQRR